MYTIFVIILILDSFILATAVLLQAGQGGGLATMGGGAGTETVMGGRQATTLLTKLTWWTAGIFLFLALVLTLAPVLLAAGWTRDRSLVRWLASLRGWILFAVIALPWYILVLVRSRHPQGHTADL